MSFSICPKSLTSQLFPSFSRTLRRSANPRQLSLVSSFFRPFASLETQIQGKRKTVFRSLSKGKLSQARHFTTLQRDISWVFKKAQDDLSLIGDVTSFSYRYTFNLRNVSEERREKKELGGGGVVMGMGYHVIDVVNKFFGPPDAIEAQFYKDPELLKEQFEDTAAINFYYKKSHPFYGDIYPTFYGDIYLSRHSNQETEVFCIRGSEGIMVLTPMNISIYRFEGKSSKFELELAKQQMISEKKAYSASNDSIQRSFMRNEETVRIIEEIYSAAKNKSFVTTQ